MKFRSLAAAAGVIGVICLTVTAFAQTSGGILHADHFDSPASMSMLEESTLAANRPTMSVFNNLTRLRLRPTRRVAWLRSPVHDELW